MGLLNDYVLNPIDRTKQNVKSSLGLLADNPQEWLAQLADSMKQSYSAPDFPLKRKPGQSMLDASAEYANDPRVKNAPLMMGATVWHGTPHKFDKFDSSKIGTGEGNQAYGHGLYLAESPDVAKMYKNTLSDADSFVGGKPFDNANATHRAAMAIKEAKENGHSANDVVSRISRSIEDLKSRNQPWASSLADEQLGTLKAISSGNIPEFSEVSKGSLYKVDLPDEHIAKMLNWDKPLSQQQGLVDSLAKRLDSTKLGNELGVYNGKIPLSTLSGSAEYGSKYGAANGADLYRRIAASDWAKQNPEAASNFLRDAGIPGVRYLDGGSRSAGAGSSNFVVFPGNEGLLNILERNGMPVK